MPAFFEDFHVGDRMQTAEYTMELPEILEFANKYDPQVFHVDETAAKQTPLGGIIASGWHTAAVMMRLIVDAAFFEATLGLGADELRWLRPVRPGDRLLVVGEILDVRPSKTKPVGIVRVKLTTKNQNGEDVMVMTSIIQPPRRA
jgi:acyl dehydratase